jgi:catalase
MAEAAASGTLIAQLVEALRALAGSHPGFRPAHAKGIVCAGTFRGAPEARRVCRAPHLQGEAVPTVIRFSNASGDPDVHDGLANPRGLSVKFQLPGDQSADVLALSIEGFPVRTPEDFLTFLRAQLPDPVTGRPLPDAVPRFLDSHPSAGAFLERLMRKPVPASYGQASYHAEHAFLFTAADGSSRFGRYHWTPEAGEAYLAPDEARQRSPNFLREELESRLRNGPVVFRLRLQVAAAGDLTDDVTAVWLADRPSVELGRLEVTGMAPTGAADERRLVFDPTNLADGIALSNDPLLLSRSAAYGLSYERRSRGE